MVPHDKTIHNMVFDQHHGDFYRLIGSSVGKEFSNWPLSDATGI